MAKTYSLAPNPKWYFADLTGKPLGSGYLAAFRTLNPSQMKLIFQDIGGLFPWPTNVIPNQGTTLGIQMDENGTLGPLYFEFDSTTPTETYFLEVYDKDGVLQWTIDNFFPSGGSGGAVVNTALDLENLIVNNVFWRNNNNSNINNKTFVTLAPGANTGLTIATSLSPAIYSPDICFVKNNASATDILSFIPFALGDTPFTNDVTPVQYFNYTCTGSGSSELFKYVQVPITQNVNNLNNLEVTFTIWARSNGGGPSNLTCQLKQFFGEGTAPSAPVNIPVDIFTLTNSWAFYTKTFTIPTVAGKTIGECHNDGLFVQIQYPLDSLCNIDIAKPSLYLGNISPDEQYQTYDDIDSVIDSPRTGDIRESYNNFMPYGWTQLDDGTIGAPASGATNRADFDTFPLYSLIWNTIARQYCPVIGGAGANAVADFIALKPIYLPRNLGRASAGTISPQIIHNYTADFTTGILTVTSGNINTIQTGSPIILTTTGTLPAGLQLNTVYYLIFLTATTFKLASTFDNAMLSISISFSNNGTPTNSFTYTAYPLGSYEGERERAITINSLPNHTHSASTSITTNMKFGSNGPILNPGISFDSSISPINHTFTQLLNVDSSLIPSATTTISPTGNGQPFNVMQPVTYRNMLIKL